MWGQVGLDIWYQFDNRIIPMRVGTRKEKAPNESGLWDHPHACGDKGKGYYHVYDNRGSSPCVWGQEVADKVSVKSTGIIPMRVGTSVKHHLTAYPCQDHPHACGDKSTVKSASISIGGSSPCVWGQERQERRRT